VELRLREGEPEFVVATPPGAPARQGQGDPAPIEEAPAGDPAAGEGAQARINLRLPEQLKTRVEQAAEQEGLSINAWLVRAVGAVVERGRSGGGETRSSQGGRRYTGWGR
jgi:hypothetical protein